MESKKLKSFEDQLSKIKPFLPQYLKEMGYDVEHGHKIRCLNPEHDDRTPSMSMFETDKGYQQQTPWVGIANTNQKLMLQAASEFGLTPSSRSRIVAGSAKGKESEDEMEALLGGDS